MSINLDNVTNILLGNTPVEQIADSLGNVLWSGTVDPATQYFYVEDVSGSDNTLSIQQTYQYAPAIKVFKSTDQQNWSSMGTTNDRIPIIATIPANGKLYLKATTDAWANNNYTNRISVRGRYKVGGNIMSLLYGDNFQNQTTFPNTSSTYKVFYQLFYNDTHLSDASGLVLPATTMTKGCYQSMFEGTSLTTAPALPATTLAEQCYYTMFKGCTSLTTAPVLPATTLVDNCYASMFRGCTSLTKVITYAQDISASGCLTSWLNGVAASGDFYNLGSATYTSGDPSGIPTGWTEHTSL